MKEIQIKEGFYMKKILSTFFATLVLASLVSAVFAAEPVKNKKASATNDATAAREKRAKQIKERNKKAKANLKVNGPYVTNEAEVPAK
jgi:NhaP-type Na+/H+ or K+/H+ antiporter